MRRIQVGNYALPCRVKACRPRDRKAVGCPAAPLFVDATDINPSQQNACVATKVKKVYDENKHARHDESLPA